VARATVKEYICKQKEGYSKGITRDMGTQSGLINITTGAGRDVTNMVITTDYNTTADTMYVWRQALHIKCRLPCIFSDFGRLVGLLTSKGLWYMLESI